MKAIKQSWRTSGAGVAMIMASLAAIIGSFSEGTQPAWGIHFPAILAGLGLLFAKDG